MYREVRGLRRKTSWNPGEEVKKRDWGGGGGGGGLIRRDAVNLKDKDEMEHDIENHSNFKVISKVDFIVGKQVY